MKKTALILCVALLLAAMLPFGASAYQYNGFIYSENADGTVTIEGLDYYIAKGDIVVPEAINGKTVSRIGSDVFSYKQFITSVTLPSGVTEIADNAFYMCVGLEKVVIPERVISIGENCFALCESLTEVTIPYSAKTIGDKMFTDCKNLRTAYIYSDGAALDEGFFSGCESLEALYLSKGVRSVASEAISDCSALKDIYCQAAEADIAFTGNIIEENGITVHYEYDYDGFPKEITDSGNPADDVSITKVILILLAIIAVIGGVAAVIIIKRKSAK